MSYGRKTITLEFGLIYSAVGKDLTGYFCSALDFQEGRCVKVEPYPTPSWMLIFHHTIQLVFTASTRRPLGILKGPVEFVGGVVKSERTAKLVGADRKIRM